MTALRQAAQQDYQTWEQWLAQAQSQGAGGYTYNPYQAGSSNVPSYSPAPRGAGTSGARLPTPATPGYVPTQRTTGGMANYPNSWWARTTGGTSSPTGGIPQATLTEFSSDPEAVARLWTMQHGFGDRTRQVLNQFSDPVALLHGIGMSQGIEGSIPARLDLTGQLFGQVLGLEGTNGQANYLDPRQIMNRVVNLRYADPVAGQQAGSLTGETNSFAASLAGPDVTPQQQVSNLIRYVGAALPGLLPRDTFDAYIRFLSNEGEKFMLWKMQNPHLSGTFNKWIGDRYGPTAGL